jgi:Spy/CpxP family protein refolding chaperone
MKYSAIILLILLGSLSSIAQIERKTESIKADSANNSQVDNKKNKQTQKDRLEELDLTREQKGKLKEIRQSGKAAKDAIESNTQLSEQEKKKQLRNLKMEQTQKVQGILTEEQKAKFRASKQNNP